MNVRPRQETAEIEELIRDHVYTDRYWVGGFKEAAVAILDHLESKK